MNYLSRYEKHFLHMLDPVVIYGGRSVVDVNAAFLVAFGYSSADDVIGRDIGDILDAHSARLRDYSGQWRDVIINTKRIDNELCMANISLANNSNNEAANPLRTIIDAAVDSIISIDEQGVIVSVNKTTEEMFGYLSSELVGRNITCLMPDEYGSEHGRYLKRYCETGEAKIVGIGRETLAKRKDGSLFDVHLAVSETLLNDKRLFTGFVRDISLLKKTEEDLRQSESRFRSAFETAAHGMALVDSHGRFIKVNNALCEMLGFQSGELCGNVLKDSIHSDDLDSYEASVAQLKIGESDSFQSETRFFHRHGHTKTMMLSVCVTSSVHSDAPHMVLQIVDISSWKHTEALLLRAKEEAERANVAKTDFLSSMSHELRTPLNAILGLSELVRLEGNLNDQQLIDMNEIEKAGKHLLAIITDILDLSRIEAGRVDYKFESVVVSKMLRDCEKLVEPKLREKSINISYDYGDFASYCIHVDSLRVKQVLLNLLSNAIKYNRPGGEVRLELSVGQEGYLRVAVCDTGYGISEENQRNLFQPFNRLGMDSSEIEGSGIGLLITKNLVEGMGGVLGYSSRLGEGSCFWVDLVIDEPVDVAATLLFSQPRANYFNDEPVVLLIGVIQASQRILMKKFNALGVVAEFAANAREAAELWDNKNYDAIFLDAAMKDADVFTFSRAIRSDKRRSLSQVPIVALLVNAPADGGQNYRNEGIDGYLVKPVHIDDLATLLKSVIHDKKQDQKEYCS